MAKHTTVEVQAQVWTEITSADVTSVTFQNLSPSAAYVAVTTGLAPSSFAEAVLYPPFQGEKNVTLSDLAPGVTGGDRVWVWLNIPGNIFVSHA